VAPLMFSCNKTLILLSYHVVLWHRMRENKLKCVMCLQTHNVLLVGFGGKISAAISIIDFSVQFTTAFPRRRRKT